MQLLAGIGLLCLLLSACADAPVPTATTQPTDAPTPLAASSPTPSVTLTPTPTVPPNTPTPEPAPTPTVAPAPTPTATPTPTVKLVLEADAKLVGYWSDRTAGVELTAFLSNEGDLKFDDTQLIAITCSRDAEIVDGCGGELRVALNDGYGPVSETLHLRVPMGKMSFSLNHGNGEPLTIPLDVPERILGVERDVWECFSDVSSSVDIWGSEGTGCAAWDSDSLVKWNQRGRGIVRGWVTGMDSWIDVFKEVMDDLAPVLNLNFVWSTSGSEPNEGIIAHIGVPRVIGGNLGETCSVGAAACASVSIRSDGTTLNKGTTIYRGNIRIHTWEGREVEFDDLSALEQGYIRSAMIHEAIHALSWMRHRTEPGSIMEGRATSRAELSPMDEALLRLYGHPLVLPGEKISLIEQLIVFNDELLDPQPNPRFAKWSLVMKAYNALREAGTAQFRVRATSPDCGHEYGWADYRIGNLTGSRFSWIEMDDGRNRFYTIQPVNQAIEHWRQSPTGWEQVPADEYADATPGWRSDLADLYSLLRRILYNADWTDATLTTRTDGLAILGFDLEPGSDGSDEVVLVIDPETFAIHEYAVTRAMAGQGCDIYRVEATDGRFDTDFQFPAAVLEQSAVLNVCDVALGTISGTVQRFDVWQRHCEPHSRTDRAEGFSRTYGFSLSDWAVVRAEVMTPPVDMYIYLSSMEGGVDSIIEQGVGSPRWDGWVQRLLPPGSYSVDVVTDRSMVPDSFSLKISVSKTPPPPLRFKSISVGSRFTCGLLEDGTPVCWGSNANGAAAPPFEERFESITTGNYSCGLRPDGIAVCWGFGDNPADEDVFTPPEGERFVSIDNGFGHTCGLREDGTAVCWGRNNGEVITLLPKDEVFTSISAGSGHTCGLCPDGAAVCWGRNIRGESSPPDGERFTAISVGDTYSCGLRDDGQAVCWGGGPNSYINSGPPLVPESERFASLSTGLPTCALRFDGTAVCWGRDTPGQASALESGPFIAISADTDGGQTCAIREDGAPVCWGWDQFGQASPPFP